MPYEDINDFDRDMKAVMVSFEIMARKDHISYTMSEHQDVEVNVQTS